MNISREIINNTERECGVQLSSMGQKLNREGAGGEEINTPLHGRKRKHVGRKLDFRPTPQMRGNL
ncbi:hypothetical protein Syun_026209 [Stephania yunnanensis]|uniref:Uncharacterized protein n=1 Tax=Stephania yunnanensis TaxID=152371 RepID=A0AAP0HW36_9MAGN